MRRLPFHCSAILIFFSPPLPHWSLNHHVIPKQPVTSKQPVRMNHPVIPKQPARINFHVTMVHPVTPKRPVAMRYHSMMKRSVTMKKHPVTKSSEAHLLTPRRVLSNWTQEACGASPPRHHPPRRGFFYCPWPPSAQRSCGVCTLLTFQLASCPTVSGADILGCVFCTLPNATVWFSCSISTLHSQDIRM